MIQKIQIITRRYGLLVVPRVFPEHMLRTTSDSNRSSRVGISMTWERRTAGAGAAGPTGASPVPSVRINGPEMVAASTLGSSANVALSNRASSVNVALSARMWVLVASASAFDKWRRRVILRPRHGSRYITDDHGVIRTRFYRCSAGRAVNIGSYGTSTQLRGATLRIRLSVAAIAALLTLTACSSTSTPTPTSSTVTAAGTSTAVSSPAQSNTSSAAKLSATGSAAASASIPSAAAGKVDANTASEEELTAAFTAIGISNAAKWAHEVTEYRPYATDDTDFTALRKELAKYNPPAGVVDQIVATLTAS